MVLEKTESIYSSLAISEMKVVNLQGPASIPNSADGGKPSANQAAARLVVEAMMAYDAMGAAEGSATKKAPAIEAATPTGRSNYQAHNAAYQLHDCNKFFKGSTNSALSRNLTQEHWAEYGNQSCKYGVSFKQCIFSGVKNQDSGIGCYAGSHDSYKKFNKFFDKIV